MEGSDSKPTFKIGHMATSFLLGTIGAFVALLLSIFIGFFFIDFSLFSDASCGADDEYVFCFFDEKWDSETYLSIITGFYGAVITVLIALLGGVAAFAFFAIRGSANERAEEAIEKEIDNYFRSIVAREMIETVLSKLSDTRIEKINRRLDELEIQLYEAEVLIDGRLGQRDEEETETTD